MGGWLMYAVRAHGHTPTASGRRYACEWAQRSLPACLYSFVCSHSLTHSPTHSQFTHSQFTHSLICLLFNSLIHSFIDILHACRYGGQTRTGGDRLTQTDTHKRGVHRSWIRRRGSPDGIVEKWLQVAEQSVRLQLLACKRLGTCSFFNLHFTN